MRILATDGFSAGGAFRPMTIGTLGRGRRDTNRATSPHIVEVLPVPGGLKLSFRIANGRHDDAPTLG